MSKERLVIDPTACRGHGLCAELLPELVRLDDWGYPIIDKGPVPPALIGRARRAVHICPTLALALRPTVGAEVPGSGREQLPSGP